MLWQLYIENIAIIEKTALEFSDGFNVFTGETGAGKSILIDAIGAVLGERVSKEMVRHGAAKASCQCAVCRSLLLGAGETEGNGIPAGGGLPFALQGYHGGRKKQLPYRRASRYRKPA